MNRVEIKNKAKEIVKNKFKDLWLGELIVVGLDSVISFLILLIFGDKSNIGLALTFVASLFISTLSVGLISYLLKIVRGESYSYHDLFKYVSEVLPIVAISLLMSLFTLLWGLLFIVPGIIAALSYSMVYYLYIDKPGKQPMEYLSMSKKLMNGYKFDYFVFILSFIGWMLLGAITFGIAYIYVIPYISTSEVLYYNELIKLKDKDLEE